MALSDIVSVTVTAQTKTVSRAGFGVPMVLAYHTANLDRYKIYTKAGFPSNMTADGHTSDDVAYKMVQAVFSQTPSPSRCVVGRRDNAWTQTVEFVPTPVAEDYVHSLTITAGDGTTATVTVTEGASSSVAALCAAFETAINATALAVTATDGTTECEIAADVAGVQFSFTGLTPSIAMEDTTPDAGVAADFAAVLAAYSDFYGVALDSQSKAENIALAASIESQKMIFVATGFSASNGDSGSTTDEAYSFSNGSRSRSAFLFHQDTHEHAGAAWLGRCLPTDPGSITWAFKTLGGVSADSLSPTFETAIATKRGSTYTNVGGVNVTYEGKTGTSFLDIIRTTDWIEARVKESVFSGLVNAEKIPFTDKGGAILQGLILAPLNQGAREDDSGPFVGSDPALAPYCIVPLVADILAADKAARQFTGIQFGATLTGAVHSTTIQGTLSL